MLIKTDVLYANSKYNDFICKVRTEKNWIGTIDCKKKMEQIK